MARTIRSDLEGVVYAYDGGDAIQLAAGDTVPDGVEVGDHLLDGKTTTSGASSGGTQAPKGNASRDEWAAYADSLGVEYDEDAGRDDIKAAVEKHQG